MRKTKPDKIVSPAEAKCCVCRRLLFKSELKKRKGFFFCLHCWPPKKVFFKKAKQQAEWEQAQQRLKILRKLQKLKKGMRKNG